LGKIGRGSSGKSGGRYEDSIFILRKESRSRKGRRGEDAPEKEGVKLRERRVQDQLGASGRMESAKGWRELSERLPKGISGPRRPDRSVRVSTRDLGECKTFMYGRKGGAVWIGGFLITVAGNKTRMGKGGGKRREKRGDGVSPGYP